MAKTSDDYEKPKAVRIPTKEEWEPFEAATRAMHPKGRSPRTAELRSFIRWYMRRPGAKLPDRPPIGPWSNPAAVEHSPPEPETPPTPPAGPAVLRFRSSVTDLADGLPRRFAIIAWNEASEEQRQALTEARAAAVKARALGEDRDRAVVEAAMSLVPPVLVEEDLALPLDDEEPADRIDAMPVANADRTQN